jgi:hypothetical protein
MKAERSCVAVFRTHTDADKAVKMLQRAGINMKRLSVVGRGYHSEDKVLGFYNTGERMKGWGKWGAFWGSIWGLLFGAAFLIIPVFGHLIILGPLASIVAGALGGATAGGALGALGAALASIGVPKDSIVRYQTALEADKFLLLVHGTKEEIEKSREVLSSASVESLEVHDAPARETADAV